MSSPASLTFFSDDFFFLLLLLLLFGATLLNQIIGLSLGTQPRCVVFPSISCLLLVLFACLLGTQIHHHSRQTRTLAKWHTGREGGSAIQSQSGVYKSAILRLCVNDPLECLGCFWLVITPPLIFVQISALHTQGLFVYTHALLSYQSLELINDLTALTPGSQKVCVRVCFECVRVR